MPESSKLRINISTFILELCWSGNSACGQISLSHKFSYGDKILPQFTTGERQGFKVPLQHSTSQFSLTSQNLYSVYSFCFLGIQQCYLSHYRITFSQFSLDQ